MPNIKKIMMDYAAPGLTVYAIVRRETDNFLLNDADGTFAAAPADYFLSMPEDVAIAGHYQANESRQVWANGLYTICIYKQSGASPFPAADTMIGDGEMVIQDDTEIANFLSSLPWTGTTTVEELFDLVLPRLISPEQAKGISFVAAINAITNLIFKRLWKRKSDLVTSEIAILFATGNQGMGVPPTFMGLKEKPYIPSGDYLEPIETDRKAVLSGKTGVPNRYELRQGMLYVWPTPIVNTIVKCEFFRNPGKVVNFSDIVPFTGVFDQVFIEGAVKFISQGGAIVGDVAFEQFIINEVDDILPVRSAPRPSRRPVHYF